MDVNNLPKVVTQWNSGATRVSNPGSRVWIPSALTTRTLSHTQIVLQADKRKWLYVYMQLWSNCIYIQIIYWILADLLCGRPNRLHYAPCPSVRPPVCLSVCPFVLSGLVIRKEKGVEKPKLVCKLRAGGVTGWPIVSSKGQTEVKVRVRVAQCCV